MNRYEFIALLLLSRPNDPYGPFQSHLVLAQPLTPVPPVTELAVRRLLYKATALGYEAWGFDFIDGERASLIRTVSVSKPALCVRPSGK